MINQEDCIVAGKITKTHNLQGEVVVVANNDFLERHADKPVFILLDGAPVPFFIENGRVVTRNHSSYIVKFEFVDSLKQAERLAGCEVLIEKALSGEEVTEEEDNDLSGLVHFKAEDKDTGHTGVVTDVVDYSGNVILSVDIFNQEVLLPFSPDYILEVDFENQRIQVQIPPELRELNQ